MTFGARARLGPAKLICRDIRRAIFGGSRPEIPSFLPGRQPEFALSFSPNFLLAKTVGC